MSEIEENRDLLNAAKDLEAQRIEMVAQAIEKNVFDLLPETWQEMSELPMQHPVEVTLTLGLTQKDADILSERDCRNLIRLFGGLADEKRAWEQVEEEEEE